VGLNLQRLTLDFDNPAVAEIWQRVYERVRDGEMPPRGERGFPAPAAKPMPVPMPMPMPVPIEPMRELPLDAPPVAAPFFPDEVDPGAAVRRAVIGSLQKLLQAARKERRALESAPPVIIRAEDSAVLRLQKQAYQAAWMRAQVNMEQYQIGVLTLDVILEATIKLYNAELPLAATHEQRVDVLTRAVAAHREIESITYTKFMNGVDDQAKFLAAKSLRLEAQVRLQTELDKKPKQLR
jgi:hypothetical protein